MASNSRNVFTESEKQCLLKLVKKHNLDKSFTQGGTSMNKKKVSWLRLVEEFNSIETNGRRTEHQLRKCWDNIKTRQKHLLAKVKKEKMRTAGGSLEPVPVFVSLGENLTEDTLFEQTMELSHAIDHDTVLPQGPQISTNSIKQEFSIRQETYEKASKREEELHSLKKKEREWMIMAAEESYKKARIERQAAEELLLYNQSKRKLIELQLLQMNHID